MTDNRTGATPTNAPHLFGAGAEAYAAHRPDYPPALFAFLADIAPARSLAWDCGTGSGQAAVALAELFERVVASDASAAQIAAAREHPRVSYRVARAEASALPARSVDLVTVAQALHWFDVPRFDAEARRVLKPHGLVAQWSYDQAVIDGGQIDKTLSRFHQDPVGDYWPPERRHVTARYGTLPFPYEPVPAPSFEMRQRWTLRDLLAYVGTWSAVARYRRAHDRDPVMELESRLAPLWGDATRDVHWPLTLRVGRVV